MLVNVVFSCLFRVLIRPEPLESGPVPRDKRFFNIKKRIFHMRLSAPSLGIFLISVIMVALVIATKYFGIDVPVLTRIVRSSMFEVLLVGYALLLAGVVFRRL